MEDFKMKINQNGLDAEIDEFGDLNSVSFENNRVKFGFRKRLTPKAIERKKYDKTGIGQLGTTYPSCYDREELIKLSKKPANFYRRDWVTVAATLFVIVIDFFCYLFMLAEKQNTKDYKIFLIATGIAVAIDFLPVFIAHNFHRKEVKRKKVIFVFNIICIIFIIAFLIIVFLYRFENNKTSISTNGIKGVPIEESYKLLYQSLLLLFIPIATSLFCFIVNYLNYNPLEKKIRLKRREILFKQEDVNELKALIAEIDSKGNYRQFLIDKDTKMYNTANDMIDSIGEYYKAYVRSEIIKKLHSPADTTELSTF